MTSADLFAISQGGQAKKVTWETFITYLTAALDGHGGINNVAYTAPASGSLTGTLTITYADHTTASFAITNGRSITTVADKWAVSTSKTTAPTTWYNDPQTMTATNKYEWHYSIITFNDNTTLATDKAVVGVYGDTAPWYVWFKFSAVLPTQDSDLSDTPNNWIGVYSGASSTAPTSYSSYKWFQYKGEKGDTGTSISSVSLYESIGLVDTYRVEFSDGTFTSFNVTNGSSISSISLTDTSGLIDTYTVTLTNGNTTTFAVHNGKGISSITEVDVTHVAGHTDVYRINYNDGDTYDFRVYNGANGSGSVSTVDGIQSVNQDVSLLQFGQGAPTTSTQGALKSRYYDQTNSILYICVGIDTSGAETTYTWQGAGVTVDDALSTSSANPVQNAVLTALIGTNPLTTTAQTLTGAVNELKDALKSARLYFSIGELGLTGTPTMADVATAMTNHSIAILDGGTIDQSALTLPYGTNSAPNVITIFRVIQHRIFAVAARAYSSVPDANSHYLFASWDSTGLIWRGWFAMMRADGGEQMTGDLVITKTPDPAVSLKHETMNIGTAPSTMSNVGVLHFHDSNNFEMGTFWTRYTTEKAVELLARVRNNGTGSNVDNVLILGVDNNGKRTVSVSETAVWRKALGLCYKANDTYNESGYVIHAGHVTGSTKGIEFSVVVPLSMENISTVTITACKGILRGIKGYLDNKSTATDFVAETGYTFAATKRSNNTVSITIMKSSVFANVDNNTPATFAGTLTLKFT